jgi:hypothetical protein
MSKLMSFVAAGLVLATATAASAADNRCGCCGQVVAPAPTTAEAPTARRSFSYEPATVAPVYRTYRYERPTTPRYLLPKADARRFST